MISTLLDRYLENICSEEQIAPVLQQEKNVLVTAGAGSGKTRTLVSRYLSLLLRYQDPTRVVAITFTEKAAEEMRSRTRSSILDLITQSDDEAEIERLRELNSKLDSARIGTIHGLCMEIILDNPAKAGIDPASKVMEEIEANLLKRKVIRSVLNYVSSEPKYGHIFEQLSLYQLYKIFDFMLNERLKIQDVTREFQPATILAEQFFTRVFNDAVLVASFERLASYSDEELTEYKKLYEVREAVRCWREAITANERGDHNAATMLLFEMRYKYLKKTGKKSPAKEDINEIRERFEIYIEASLGFKGPGEKNLISDVEYDVLRQAMLEIFIMLNSTFEKALIESQSLDFDSMESHAVRLLRDPEVRATWQAKIDSLMVDEFQDTNERQREIVLRLTEDRDGKLFVVGDARQSIYRFRQADVAVFKRMMSETIEQGGSVMELSTSYRTHEGLLNATGELLARVMGTQEYIDQPYKIHFTPLNAFHKHPLALTEEPFVEFLLADLSEGEAKVDSMDAMAYALSDRLIEARRREEISSWKDVAVLCRTTLSFEPYENAFELAGIPYVTSAGRGFLERKEIKDLINILRALADPGDDLAMAGLLRSPMFGLSDVALFQLRGEENIHFLEAINGDLSALSNVDRSRAETTRERLAELLALVDRVPVPELIKKVVDTTHYLAILATFNHETGSQRQWRNIEKLINDARDSGTVLLRDYIDLIDNYDELGLKIGEAPSEAVNAVRLMTIHSSKGLEFPWIVLGEASRNKSPKFSPPAIFDKTTGLAFRTAASSLHYQMCLNIEREEEQAEADRVLYVALTRAINKVIINGVRKTNRDGELSGGSWLVDLGNALGTVFDLPQETINVGDSEYRVEVSYPTRPTRWDKEPMEGQHDQDITYADMLTQDLLPLIAVDEGEKRDEGVARGLIDITPAEISKAEGSLTHKAIELGIYPNTGSFANFSRSFLLRRGITDDELLEDMRQRVAMLLERYAVHPISAQISDAEKKYHELNYSFTWKGYVNNGIIDLLVLLEDGWSVIDFKTDRIRDENGLQEALERHRPQLERYQYALRSIQNINAKIKICFLDDHGEVTIHEL